MQAADIRLTSRLRNLTDQTMKMNSLKVISAVVAGIFVLATTLYAQTGGHGIDSRTTRPAIEATGITKADAEKKYPPPSTGYPRGERDPTAPSGVVASPYPPHQKYDCSKIAHGGLVLDIRAKKVFVYP
jgi:hypothetical protein